MSTARAIPIPDSKEVYAILLPTGATDNPISLQNRIILKLADEIKSLETTISILENEIQYPSN